jgi:hypothetical protein
MPANWLGMKEVPRPAEEGDFYPTPPGATLALLQKEDFPGPIWEPACGAGDISKVVEEAGYRVVSSDFFDRGYGMPGIDYFSVTALPLGCRSINSAGTKMTTTDWIRHTTYLAGLKKMALFMKTTALAGKSRSLALAKTGFCRLLQFRGRIKCKQGELAGKEDNSAMMEFAWFIFEPGFTGEPTIRWIDEINYAQPELL